MAEGQEVTLDEVLTEIQRLYPASDLFTRSDDEAIPEMVATLTVVATTSNLLALRQYGGRLGPQRGKGLLEQVIAAAFQTFGGEDPHPHPFQKAAMLLRGIIQGHPFSDGNKRTGFVVASYYLHRVGYRAPGLLSTEEVVEFCLEVSAGKIRDVEEMARRLCQFWHCRYLSPLPRKAGSRRVGPRRPRAKSKP